MLLHKLKIASVALVAVGAASGGLVWAVRASRAANPSPPALAGQATAPRAAEKAAQPPRDPSAATPPGTVTPGLDPFAATTIPLGPIPGSVPPIVLRGKNSPNMIDPRHLMPILRTSGILVAESPGRRSLMAMSLELSDREEAAWEKLELMPGITATPLINDDTVALMLKGKSINHVAAFSRYTGKWSVQPLEDRAEDELTPYLLPGGVVYQVGKDIYAFSSRRGTWGVCRLTGADEPRIAASPTDIEVLHGNKLYVFSLAHGGFSAGIDVNLKPFQTGPQVSGPGR